MTEAAAIYKETQKERNALKNAAFHKKNGSANTKLGNKHMTNQEIEERHGECKTYNVNDLTMTFPEFREMPNDLQIEFLNKLQDKYDIGIKQIGRELFRLPSDDALRSHLQLRKIWKFCNPDKSRAKTGLLQFRKDIDEARKRAKLAQIIDIRSAMPDPDDVPKFLEWKDFMQLSDQEKVIFVNRLLDEYGVGMGRISSVLFKKYATYLRGYLKSCRLLDQIHVRPAEGKGKTSRGNWQQFQKDVDVWRGVTEESEPISAPVPIDTDDIPLFLEWKQVKQLSNEQLIVFYNRLLDTYGIGMLTIDKELFLFQNNKTRKFLVSRGVLEQVHASKVGELNVSNEAYATKVQRFHDDIQAWREGTMPIEEVPEEPAAEEKPEPVEIRKYEPIAEEDLDDICDPNDFWSSSAYFEKPILEEEPEEIAEKATDPMVYRDASFTTNYIREGLDLDQFHALALLFDGKRVKVEISVTEI